MKKGLTIAFVFAAVAATAIIIYLNKRAPTPEGLQSPISQLGSDDIIKAPEADSIKKLPQASWPRQNPQNIDEEKKQRINSYLENSRFNQAIQFIEKELTPMFEGMLNDDSLSEDERNGIRRFLDRMQADSISEEYRQRLNEKFSNEELAKLDEIYQDATVQEFMREQQDMMMQGSEENYFKFMDNFDVDQLPKDRQDALSELYEIQMKMVPKDMFGSDGMAFESILSEAKQEVMARVAFSGRNMSTEQILRLSKQLSQPVSIGAGQEQIRMIMNITKESVDAMSN